MLMKDTIKFALEAADRSTMGLIDDMSDAALGSRRPTAAITRCG
jgi:hypothetical protein